MLTRGIEGLRQLGVGTLAGGAAGVLAGGIGGRVVMRISGALTSGELAGRRTENGNVVGEITLAGTFDLLFFSGLLTGIAGGWVVAMLRPSLAWAGRWRGAVLGAVLLSLAGPLVIDPDNRDFRTFGVAPLNVAMFAGLFFVFGILVETAFGWIEKASRRPWGSTSARVLAAVAYLVALPAIAAGASLVVNAALLVAGVRPLPSGEGTLIAIIGAMLVVAILATRLYEPLRHLGYMLLGLLVAITASHTVGGIVEILAD